jgi:hypothetical protein
MRQDENTRFEVLTAAKGSMLVFWVVTPSGLIGSPEDGDSRYLPTGQYGVTIQKTNIGRTTIDYKLQRLNF